MKNETLLPFKRVALIVTGHVASSLRPQFGSYFMMFAQLLKNLLPSAEITEFDVIQGQFPQYVDDYDLYVITGSKHGVYENLSWIEQLRNLAQKLIEVKIPTVGICFGHQIIAQACSAKVDKFTKGWQIGLLNYEIYSQALNAVELPNQVAMEIPTIHQDQVLTLPKGAKVWTSREQCKYAGLVYPKIPMITMQAHPEFSIEYSVALLKERANLFSKDLLDSALQSYDKSMPATKRFNSVEAMRFFLVYLTKNLRKNTPEYSSVEDL